MGVPVKILRTTDSKNLFSFQVLSNIARWRICYNQLPFQFRLRHLFILKAHACLRRYLVNPFDLVVSSWEVNGGIFLTDITLQATAGSFSK